MIKYHNCYPTQNEYLNFINTNAFVLLQYNSKKIKAIITELLNYCNNLNFILTDYDPNFNVEQRKARNFYSYLEIIVEDLEKKQRISVW